MLFRSKVVADSNGAWGYTLTKTDYKVLGQGNVIAKVTATDVLGNVNKNVAPTTFTIDTVSPTATITLNDTALQIGEAATVTITFSEAVNGFTLDNLTAANGVLSNLSNATTNANGSVTYTATFTPTQNIEDTSNVVTLNASYTDHAGNVGNKIGRAHV